MKSFLSWLDTIAAVALFAALVFGTVYLIFNSFAPTHKDEIDNFSTSSRPLHKDMVLMYSVQNIQVEVSTLMLSPYFSLGMDEPGACLIAAAMKSDEHRNSPVLTSLAAKQSDKCELAIFVRGLTLPVFEAIAISRTLPLEASIFQVYENDRWIKIGMFDSLDSCVAAQQAASKIGLGTKVCVSWLPSY